MKYSIVHDLPGRLRVHCRNLCRDSDNSLELDRWLAAHAGLRSASLSMRTGNLLITYSRDTSREAILVMLDDLRLFGVAKVVRRKSIFDVPVTAVAMDACVRETYSLAFGLVIPDFAQLIIAGWKMASRLFGMSQALERRDYAGFCFAAARFALFLLRGKSLLFKCAVALARSFLKHSYRIHLEMTGDMAEENRFGALPYEQALLPVPVDVTVVAEESAAI